MDKNRADNAQDVDKENEANQAMEDCLRNPVIVRIVLKHFSSKELLQISLVNKLWKYEARSVVSQRGNLIANLRSKQRPWDTCETVAAFVSDLPKLGAAPFSGIRFDNDYNYEFGQHVCFFAPEDLDRMNDVNLLDQLSLRNVSVKTVGDWQGFINCPAFLLAKKVIQQFCGSLEELELSISVEEGENFEELVQDCYFTRMKILRASWDPITEDTEGYVRALLSRAPKLQVLYTNWNLNSALELLQGSSVEFVYTAPVRAPFNEVTDNVISAIRLERMELEYTGPEFNFERFNRIAPTLLQAPRTTTIRYINIDAVLAVPLMCFGARLENVETVGMDIGRMELIEQRILNVVKNFDFTRIFPNLDKVYVVSNNDYAHGFPPEHVNALMERANTCLAEPLLNRAAHIKKLCLLSQWHPSSVASQFFLHMFPNVEKLEIVNLASSQIPFGSIWNWVDLNELEVKGIILPTSGNLDSVFCGIFLEEVEELRQKDDDYLKQVNIVPSMPAVTFLRNLRTINLNHFRYSDEPFFDDDIFSKVTALVAFARMPGLAVNLKISAPTALPAMSHLKPYVSVTSGPLEDQD